MSLRRRLADHGRLALSLLGRQGPGRAKTRRVLVLERVSENDWKAVEGEIGGDCIRVRAAQILSSGDEAPGYEGQRGFDRLANNTEAILVANSHKSVCRFLDLVDASPDQMRRMVALRLETELPYPVTESTWVCERQEAGDTAAGSVLVIATATAEIAQAEDELRAKGIRCTGLEFDAAVLAELALACHPSDETIAVVSVDGERATLAITEAGLLRYVRHIAGDRPALQDSHVMGDWVAHMVNELDQSVYDYLLRTDGKAPARMMIVGEQMYLENLTESLGARLRIPVEAAHRPELFHIPNPAAIRGDVIAVFPACVGALVALHRRTRGERTAAPALRRRRRPFGEIDLRSKRTALIGINAVLLVALIAALFGLRAAQLTAAKHIIDESRPLLQGLERLQDEVDILQYESRRQRSVLDALFSLAEALPKEVKIEELAIDAKGKVAIRGRTSSVEAASEKAMSALGASAAFVAPKFMGITKEKEDFGFRITCELSKGAGGGGP